MALQCPNLTASAGRDFEYWARIASQIDSLRIPKHVRPDESIICIKLTFWATRMNWTMTKKMIMNTESMTTIPPPVQTIMMRSYCQLMNGLDTVTIQPPKAQKGLTQIPSRQLTDSKERNSNQLSGEPIETVLSCQRTHNHIRALLLDFLAKIWHSSFQWIMLNSGLQGVRISQLPIHLLKVCRRQRATRIASCHSIKKQLLI